MYGALGVNFYSNLAVDAWGLLMDDITYNGVDVSWDHQAKIGLIDSGNNSIQLPNTMFERVKREMQKIEMSVYEAEVDSKKILVARKACHELYDTLGDLTFSIQDTTLTIGARGYLYHLNGQNSECFIGI